MSIRLGVQKMTSLWGRRASLHHGNEIHPGSKNCGTNLYLPINIDAIKEPLLKGKAQYS